MPKKSIVVEFTGVGLAGEPVRSHITLVGDRVGYEFRPGNQDVAKVWADRETVIVPMARLISIRMSD